MSEREHLTDHSPHEGAPTVPERAILILLAVILPPLPIFLLNNYSIFNREFLVSILLTVFGHIPGTVFSIYYILIEYPRAALASQTNSDYVRLPDDEESNIAHAAPGSGHNDDDHHHHHDHHYNHHQANEGVPPQPQEAPQHHQEPELHDDVANAPPSYEAVAGSSDGSTTYPADVKGSSSDNKVQR